MKRSACRNQLLNEVEGAESAGTLPTRIRWFDPGKAKRRAGRRGGRRPSTASKRKRRASSSSVHRRPDPGRAGGALWPSALVR